MVKPAATVARACQGDKSAVALQEKPGAALHFQSLAGPFEIQPDSESRPKRMISELRVSWGRP
jgi:hypothetical protein